MSELPPEPFKMTLDKRKILYLGLSFIIVAGTAIYNVACVSIPYDKTHLFDCLAATIIPDTFLTFFLTHTVYDSICQIMFIINRDRFLTDTRGYVDAQFLDKLVSRRGTVLWCYIGVPLSIYMINFVMCPSILAGQLTIDQS